MMFQQNVSHKVWPKIASLVQKVPAEKPLVYLHNHPILEKLQIRELFLVFV